MSEDSEASRLQTSMGLEGYDALRESAALVGCRSADWLRIVGADRLRFANGLVSCDLRSLEPGNGAYGFLTDRKGKILADAAFLAFDSALWIELPEGLGTRVAGHMGNYLVADNVELEELVAWNTVFVAGPAALAKLTDVLAESLESGSWSGAILETGGGPLLVRADRRLGVPSWVLAGSHHAIASVTDSLLGAGIPIAGEAAVAAHRIEHGVPWFGLDFGPEVGRDGSLPQETGIEDWAVSFEKGCYLGQEVIARVHFRGKVNRGLRGLIFQPGPEPQAGAELALGEEVVGVLNSVAESPTMGRPLGLAIVHHKAEPGCEVATPTASCRLIELPFGSRS